jgi:LacI family transcriptional regulator
MCMSKPTIEDVAKLADVSTATVSRVINKKGGVRKKTEDKILNAIDELKYYPNAVARSMVRKETKTIGIIIPDIKNPFFPLVVAGIEQKAQEKGYFTILSNTNESPIAEEEIIKVFMERGLDGLIITTSDENGLHLKPLIDQNIPLVAVDRSINNFEIDTVLVGNIDGSYQATRHLILHGHENIAIVCGPQSTTPGYERYEGYKRALKEYNLTVKDEYVEEGNFKEESGYEIVKKLYSLKERPTAIFSSNNLMTIGCLKAMQDLGWKLGEEVSLIGFDDVDVATFIKPKLTVVSRPMQKLGEHAFNLLYERMNSTEEVSKKTHILSPELVIRESCDLSLKIK